MNELATRPDSALHVGKTAEQASARGKVIELAQHVPNLIDAIRRAAPTDTFRVLMSAKNAHLFRQAADGTWNPVLRVSSGQIQEHAHLVQSGANVFSALPNVILAVAMAKVSERLSSIDAKLDQVHSLLLMSERGQLQGHLMALDVARRLSDPRERRTMVLMACQGIVGELGGSVGRLKALIEAMPQAKTRRFEGLFNSGFDKADKAFRAVMDEVQIIGHSTARLLQAFGELEEAGAHSEAMSKLVDALQDAGLPAAISKARLLPAKVGHPAPETGLCQLQDGMAMIGTHLLGQDRAGDLAISIDLQAQELCLV